MPLNHSQIVTIPSNYITTSLMVPFHNSIQNVDINIKKYHYIFIYIYIHIQYLIT